MNTEPHIKHKADTHRPPSPPPFINNTTNNPLREKKVTSARAPHAASVPFCALEAEKESYLDSGGY